MNEIKSIQLWPSGKSVVYSTTDSGYHIHEHGTSRPATDDETHQIRVNLHAQTLLDREVLAVQTSLVDDLIREGKEGFEYDEIQNLYPDSSQDSAVPAEIYEWWLVTGYLARILAEIGQPVLDNGYGTWWGRTCTGQQVIMDGTLQECVKYILAR